MNRANLKFIKDNKIYIILLLFIIFFNVIGITFSKKESKSCGDIVNIFSNTNKENIIQIVKENKNLNLALNIFILFLAILTLSGFGVLISSVVAKLKKTQLFPKASTVINVSWGIGDVIRLGILFIFIAYILNIFYSICFYTIDVSGEFKRFVQIFNASIVDIFLFFILIYFVKHRAKNKLSALGFTFKNFFKNIIIGISGYAASIPLLLGILSFSVFISNLFNYHPLPEPIFIFLITTKNLYFIIYSIIFICIIGPIVEEMFFRGFTYNAIKKKFGIKPAIVISALVFSLLHINPVGFLPIFFLGVVFAYLYQRTGSLIPSIITHILHNSIMVSLVLIFRKIMILKLNL